LTINKNKFRSTLMALAFGALVTVVPASATTIGLSVAPTIGAPTYVEVGGTAWGIGGYSVSGTLTNGILTLAGDSGSDSFLNVNGQNTCNCNYTGSGVVDVTVTPTINGGPAQTAVTFQGSIIDNGGTFSLYFGNQGSTTCTTNCYNTGNGYAINNGQTAANGYTTLVSNGIDYEIASSTLLTPTKAIQYVGGFVGIVGAPEPATYATTGLGIALLGFFLRRKKQNS
jgi:hypothetical protein